MVGVPSISKELLEELVGNMVDSFTITPGTNVGDNTMSVIYSIEVKLVAESGNGGTVHLLSKCYPGNPARQEFLNMTNSFWKELSIYQVLIPDLKTTAHKLGICEDLPFPPLVGGKGVNFQGLQKLGDKSYDGKIFGPFDIYIMMTDLRKTCGFRMADRQTGLDVHHMNLVVCSLAKLHALSWGYQKSHGLGFFADKFDFFKVLSSEEKRQNMWLNVMERNLDLAANTIGTAFGTESEFVTGTRKIKEHMKMLMDCSSLPGSQERVWEAHRVKPMEMTSGAEPWRVLIHGDCWTNNILFRYDEDTLSPVEVILVDLTRMREDCPTLDMVYLVYTSTTTEFRKNHLDNILELYHLQFIKYCNIMNVDPLPNFTLQELRRRFHRGKAFGYLICTTLFPMMLNDAEDAVDLEAVVGGTVDVFESIFQEGENNSIYSERIISLAEEMREEGVI